MWLRETRETLKGTKPRKGQAGSAETRKRLGDDDCGGVLVKL
jgi:hypothetical protein